MVRGLSRVGTVAISHDPVITHNPWPRQGLITHIMLYNHVEHTCWHRRNARNCTDLYITMAAHTIQDLTEALHKLTCEITPRKEHLEARLRAGEQISDEDSKWLDHTANLVDERSALDILMGASDYDSDIKKLTPAQKAAIERL